MMNGAQRTQDDDRQLDHATALVCIDLNYLNLPSDSGSYYVERITNTVIPNVNRLCATIRANGGTVIWVRPELRMSNAGDWPRGSQRMLRRAGLLRPTFHGESNFPLLPTLDTLPTDVYLTKFCTSVFWGGRAAATLRACGASTVLVTGCLTEGGVVINAIDATHNGFQSVVVEDASAGRSEERHLEALWLRRELFSVESTSSILSSSE